MKVSKTSDEPTEMKFNTFPEFPKPTIKDKIQVGKLLSIQKVEQRTPEWYSLRMTMITASDWATAIGEGHFGNKNDFILKKCGKGPKFKGNIYTEWGVKYEDVATRLYELRTKNKIYEFGVLKHPNIPFLGASPDGITAKGIMLEIKCPYSRKITGIVPRHYWMQIQGQLEVCDLAFCDFLECKITEYTGMGEYLDDTEVNPPIFDYGVNEKLQKKYENGKIFLRTEDGMEKGAVLTYNTPNGENKYFHSELGISKEEFEEWCSKIKESVPSTWVERRVSFWRFDKISCVRVERDIKWFEETLPKLEETWNQVEHYKKVGCESLMKNKKGNNQDLIEDADESEINALVNTTDGYDDMADSFLNPVVKIPEKDNFDDFDDIGNIFMGKIESKTEIIQTTSNKVEKNENQSVTQTISKTISQSESITMIQRSTETDTKNILVTPEPITLKPITPKPITPIVPDQEWLISQMEAIFDLELGSWSLPKYIPLNPVVINKRSIEEFKMNLVGICKLVTRCKTALVRLTKCSPTLIDASEINIRNIANRVNNWFNGFSDYLRDLLETLDDSDFTISKELEKNINNTRETAKNWVEKLYPKWLAKWD